LLVAQEVFAGALIGFASSLVFAAITMAASLMGVQIGFSAASLFDPLTASPTGALEQFYSLLSMVLFLSINGHHWLILALTRTFSLMPLGTFALDELTIERLVVLTNATFVAAVRIALPVAGALLLTDVGLGLIARAVPQVQVFFLGMPLKMGLGFVVLAFTLIYTLPLLRELLQDASNQMLLIGGH
jgi:flagellar biosynthetic protein FliR